MSWFVFWQPKEGDCPWELALADAKDQIIREHQPPLMTVLDLDTAITEENKAEMKAEDWAAIKYRGPLYFDFDSDSIETVIPKFQQFLGKLEELGLNLHQLSLFASGGKGFHITIPPACFIEKPVVQGYAFLPHIYREIAEDLFVDTLDMRVYSARRGRMFRVENVRRKNDRYKVPISVAEAKSMTEEMYVALTSTPRVLPAPAAPTYCVNLALKFVTAKDKVGKAMERRKKNKGDEKLIAKFKGDFPQSLAAVLDGTGVNDKIGFQKLALQLAIISHKLGKSQEQLIQAAEGVIQSHQSDGTRYNTPSKRREELKRMYDYMYENPCYDLTVGGLKSMMVPGTPTPDLDDGFDGSPQIDENGVTIVPAEEDFGVTLGMRVSRAGIFAKREDGMLKISNAGWDSPRELIELETDTSAGFLVEAYRDGISVGERRLEKDCFASRSKMLNFTHSLGCNINATDAQVGGLLDTTRAAAKRLGKPVYTLEREGVDYVKLPGGKTDADRVIVYASRDGVFASPNETRVEGINFLLHRSKGDPRGEFKTDIHDSPALTGSAEERSYLNRAFKLNKPVTIAKVLGFMLASWISQQIRASSKKQFPLLAMFGEPGSGKSGLVDVMIQLHYNQVTPRNLACTSVSKYFLEASTSSSASIPLILDEFKTDTMDARQISLISNILRNNWDQKEIGKGTVDKVAKELSTESMANASPIIYTSEKFISEQAIVERSVVVPMRPSDREDEDDQEEINFCSRNRHLMSAFGRSCLDASLGLRVKGETGLEAMLDNFNASLSQELRAQIKAAGITAKWPSRQIHGLSCILMGLEFGRLVLAQTFGTHFDETFEQLKACIVGDVGSLIQSTRSEQTDTLDKLAYMSHGEEPEWALRLGREYAPYEDKKTHKLYVDIQLTDAFNRYLLYCKRYTHRPSYERFESFKSAMHTHSSCVSKKPQSAIRLRPFDEIARFDLEKLYKERITTFRDLELAENTTVASN